MDIRSEVGEQELEAVVAGYRHYLQVERGLSDATVACYEPRARRFLSRCAREGLDQLTASEVSGFIAREWRLCEIPHNRHTNAMLLKANGVDVATIALWLGHESIKTTGIYQHADLAMKAEAIARTAPLGAKPGRYQPADQVLAFLEAL